MQDVLSKFDDESLRVQVVWIPAIASDNYRAAIDSRRLISDPRAKHYYDTTRALGQAFAPVLGTRMTMAWDVYIGFDGGAVWKDGLPRPADWLHQKRSEESPRYLDPAKLEAMLQSITK